jgi:hypothetical protein
MGRVEALIQLGLSGQDFGPCYQDEWTHAEFSAKWRGTAPCPSEVEIEAAKAQLPAVPIPQSVTPLQATRALLQAGFLDDVETAVAAAGRETQLAWAKATAFERNSSFVLNMQAALGWTDAQVDSLFVLADSL